MWYLIGVGTMKLMYDLTFRSLLITESHSRLHCLFSEIWQSFIMLALPLALHEISDRTHLRTSFRTFQTILSLLVTLISIHLLCFPLTKHNETYELHLEIMEILPLDLYRHLIVTKRCPNSVN